MALSVTFELEDEDIDYFRETMAKARDTADRVGADKIIDSARIVLEELKASNAPNFVKTRVGGIESLITMLGDAEWGLADNERTNIVNALAYFADPEDLIPDEIPVLGFIDDAIMFDLVLREMEHEIDAYDDFCIYRHSEEIVRGPDSKDPITREQWLASRRKSLHARMRRRRARRGLGRSRSGMTSFSLF